MAENEAKRKLWFSLSILLVLVSATGFSVSALPDGGFHWLRFIVLLLLLTPSYIYIASNPAWRPRVRLKIPVALFFGFGFAVGRFFWNQAPFTSSPRQIGVFLLTTIGAFIFYAFLVPALYRLSELGTPLKDASFRKQLPTFLRHTFTRHSFLSPFIFLLIAWLIPFIIHYPAGVCMDVNNELEQGLEVRPYNTGHPLGHVLLVTNFVKAGHALGNVNLGIFILEILITLCFAAFIAYGFSYLVQRGAPVWSLGLMLFFYAFSPWIVGTVGDAVKDVHYSVFVFLLVILLARFADKPSAFFSRPIEPLLLFVAFAGTILFRNNGIHVVVITLLAAIPFTIVKLRMRSLPMLALIVIAVGAPLAFNSHLVEKYNPEPFRVTESLGLPLQQTARLTVEHPESITEEEAALLRQVVALDKLPELYDPYLVDPIKGAQEFPEELVNPYLKVWAKEGLREPVTYMKATWQQNLFLLYPEIAPHNYYVKANFDANPDWYTTSFLEDPKTLIPAKEAFGKYLHLMHTLPGFTILQSLAIYVMSVFVLGIFAFTRKAYRFLIPLLPLLASLLVVIAAPGLLSHPRYAYPIIFAIPYLWAHWTSVTCEA